MSFDRHIGIDYLGAGTPASSLKGLHTYLAHRTEPPYEVGPFPTRANTGIAPCVTERLLEDDAATTVGISHEFFFPTRHL